MVSAAQKGGTTWLSSELRQLNVNFPFGKEGHVWTNVEKINNKIEPKRIPLLFDKKGHPGKNFVIDKKP